MNNPITYALMDIKRNIPGQILSRFFMPVRYHQLRRDPFMPNSVDDMIIEKVINGQVRLDCDIAGASEVTIDLRGLQLEIIDRDKYVIHIPKERTNGRVITSALALIYYGLENVGMAMTGAANVNMGMATMGKNGCSCSDGSQLPISGLMNQYKPLMMSQTSNVRVVDGHTILISDLITPTPNAYLRCVLAHDSTFSTLSPPAWKHFGKLCTLATKQYIYTQHILDIDMAELTGGQELGKFKEIVESYSDAGEQYEEFYHEKWRKIQFMSDEARHQRFMKAMVGRYK